MKENIQEQVKLMHKLMHYDRSKTISENTLLFEDGIISEPPPGWNGSSTNTTNTGGGGGGNRGGGGGGRRGGGYSAPPKPIPTELKDVDGVKKFQDWLDTNKAGWAYGYDGGKVSQGKGWGRYGPRTQKAWSQYKDEYINTGTNSNPYAGYTAVEGGDGNVPPTSGGVEGANEYADYKVEGAQAPNPTQELGVGSKQGERKIVGTDTFVWDNNNKKWLSDAEYLKLYNQDGTLRTAQPTTSTVTNSAVEGS